MGSRFLLTIGLFSLQSLAVLSAALHDEVVVPPVKTSIYVGSVTLITTPLKREDQVYRADYRAKVFPYFFMGEQGTMTIDFTAEQLVRLDRGERVEFAGKAKNEDNEERRIEGHVVADAPGAPRGKIKVRIFVSAKIELIFNTLYELKGAS